ncbi:MAG: hypothetical protein RLZZ535_1471 [Cyanobacteriota bacterium]
MKLKALTTVILLNTMILIVPRPSLSQVVLDESLLAEELETEYISPKIQIAQAESWSGFKLKLGQRETGEPNPPYNIENSLGFIGKYQFGEALLIDLGYYQAEVFYNGGENGVDKNYWEGTWTGKEGINSKEDFLNNNNVQEIAIEEAFNLFWDRITSELSIENYLGGSVEGVPITCSGILAAAHLRGEYGVINLLRNGYVTRDEYNTSILEYLDEFQGYQTPYCQ